MGKKIFRKKFLVSIVECADMLLDMEEVVVTAPSQLSASQLAHFCELVKKGGEVAHAGLERRIRQAHLVAFIQVNSEMAAVGAIKRPSIQHRGRIERQSGYRGVHNCSGELGYLYVEPQHRRKGFGRRITQKLLAAYGKGLYATTRAENAAAHRVLRACGFITVGDSWPSKEHPGEEIRLWVPNNEQAD